MLDFHLDFGWQTVLERNRGVGRPVESQIDSYLAIANFAGHVLHGGGGAPVLRPRKPFEPYACGLTVSNAAEGNRRSELRYDFERAVRHDGADAIARLHHSSDLQRGHFREGSRNRRANLTLINLVIEAFRGSHRRAPAPFDFGN